MKTFIIKNLFNQELGKIIYLLKEKKFKIDFSSDSEKKKIELLLSEYLKQGIKYVGNVILAKPIKSDGPLFLLSVQNQLAKKGYIVIIYKRENIIFSEPHSERMGIKYIIL
ncbi:MAG: hypothetical protein LRZ92_03535 [Methanosarcinaceae archaeon]|nr:hypothetical protein [Methanosarcinaceae archaeon]